MQVSTRSSRRRALLAGVLASLLVTVLAPAVPVSAQQAGPRIAPSRTGNTAVQAGHTVRVSGEVGPGEVTQARLIAVLADGTQAEQRIDGSVLGASDDPVRGGDYLRNDGGTLDGRLTLFCLFAAPRESCSDRPPGAQADTRQVVLEVVVEGRLLQTPPVRVDYTRPRLRDALLTAPRTVVARFTEPVRSTDGQPDNPVDWEVRVGGSQVPVLAVTGAEDGDCVGSYQPGEDAAAGNSGCTRTLRLGADLDEDARPEVDYVRTESRVPSEGYEDFADNRIFDIGTGARTALDVVRPAVPTITSVNGRAGAPATVVGRSTTPVLGVSNLRAGHDVYVERLPPDGPPVRGESTTAGDGGTAAVTAPSLPGDGPHVLRVVARDPSGNLSTETGKRAGRADGGPSQLTYVLDTVAPAVVGALAEPDGRARVLFSEDVSGPDDPGHFAVRVSGQPRTVQAVDGSGSSRRVTVQDGVPGGARLDYAPGGGARYADAAGNVVPDRFDVLVAGLPAPIVDVPAGQVFTSATGARVAGSLPGDTLEGVVVEVFRDADRNGQPDGAALASAPVDAGRTWATDVALLPDAPNDLLVRASQTDLQGPVTAVPTIVQDATAPDLGLVRPVGGEVLAGGEPTTVTWSTADRNPGTVRVDVSADGETFSTEVEVPASADGTQSAQVPLPDVDTTAARVRITATDRAGNVTTVLSLPFTIDAVAPSFRGLTTTSAAGPTDVHLTFSEPVTGPLAPGDFQVAGQPASVVSVDGPGSTPALARGATRLLLRVAVPFGADARPTVSYVPSGVGELEDRAGQGVPQAFRAVDAVDGIRPPTPSIESVDGRPAEASFDGRQPEPTLTVTGVAAGHTVVVERLVDGVAVETGPEVTASGASTTVQAAALPADGDHVLRAVVRDENGNLSTDQDKPASPADRGPSNLTYRLDTLVPSLVSAVSAQQDVTVLLSEPVSGTDDPAHWSIPGRTIEQVRSGDGTRTRVLTVGGGPVAGLPLTYAPSSGRYVDAAGNAVPDATVVLDGIGAPVVQQPAAPLFTAAQQVTVAGVVRDAADGPPRPGTVVDVLRDTDADGVGDDGVVRGVPVSEQGAWSVAVPLVVDSRNSLHVVSRTTDGAVEPSGQVAVPVIVQDGRAPALEVTSPSEGAALAGGAPGRARWTTSDANPASLEVELTTDGTSFFAVGSVTPPADGAGELTFPLPDVDTDVAQIRITAVDRAGNSAQALSPVFTIDALNPTFVALTTAPRTVRLTFSEPVSGRVSPLTDFRVDGQPATVSSIEGSPSTTATGARAFELTVPSGVGEDARPAVTYAPSSLGELVDRAQQPVVERTVTAVDGIRPAVPTVTAVDGRAPQDGRVRGGSVVPQVSVSNLVAGQFVRVERVPTAGLPVAGPEVETQSGSALVPGPRLPGDGEHVLRVVVRDATGNTSTDTAKNPGRGDGGPSSVTYVLDTQLPAILFAVADDDDIVVRFTEPLFPAGGQPADWRVTRPDGSPVPLGDGSVTVVAVRGAGDTRVLQATGVQPGSLLVYSPVGERYADAHANPLPDTTTPLLALEPPIVTTPARALLVTTSSTTVGGTSQPGSTVSLFRRGRDGGPSGAAVASAGTGDDGRWSLSAPLEVDVANDFLVQARRTDGRTTIAVAVPTIDQDSAAPVLSVDGFPGDQQRFAPGSARTLSWSVCDAHLGETPIVLEFSADDGATWTRLGPERLASPNDCAASTSRRVTLPGTAETSSARLRVSAIDLAGRTTRIDSPRFVLTGDTVVRDVRGYACPPERVQPAGFTDTATSTFRFEIDCLAAYRFTKGVTADRYEPLGDVTRAQMALFVARVAAYAGVPLNTSDAGFTDMGGRSQETRDAVNALANLGVVQGVGGGRYAPADPVSRGQMASFLARVQRSVGTPFPSSRDTFRDDDRTTHEANIDAIAGAGIVQGTAPDTYQPLAPITRQQMAGFLVRYVDSQVEAGRMRSAY